MPLAASATTYRFVVRGGPTFRIRIEDGSAITLPSDGEADCTIRARPAALVFVSYGRVGPWRAALSGKLLGERAAPVARRHVRSPVPLAVATSGAADSPLPRRLPRT